MEDSRLKLWSRVVTEKRHQPECSGRPNGPPDMAPEPSGVPKVPPETAPEPSLPKGPPETAPEPPTWRGPKRQASENLKSVAICGQSAKR